LHKPHVVTSSNRDFLDVNVSGTLNLLEEAVAAGSRMFRLHQHHERVGCRADAGRGRTRGVDHRGHSAGGEEYLRRDQDRPPKRFVNCSPAP